jgi:hypothetical protein
VEQAGIPSTVQGRSSGSHPQRGPPRPGAMAEARTREEPRRTINWGDRRGLNPRNPSNEKSSIDALNTAEQDTSSTDEVENLATFRHASQLEEGAIGESFRNLANPLWLPHTHYLAARDQEERGEETVNQYQMKRPLLASLLHDPPSLCRVGCPPDWPLPLRKAFPSEHSAPATNMRCVREMCWCRRALAHSSAGWASP